MKDNFGREIDYLRVSITDRCNLRCRYCMPDGIETLPMKEILTLEEIVAVCQEVASLGVQKIKITGGEPLVRKGAPALIGMIKKIPGISNVTMTTNGVLLLDYLEELQANGLDGVNVSLDTVDPTIYKKITGRDYFDRVMEGIDRALEVGMKLKINTVLQKGVNEEEWMTLLQLARIKRLDLRFIELMPIGMGKTMQGISNEEILKQLKEQYPNIKKDDQKHGNGPAVYYKIPEFLGSIGFISAIHGKFCGECNRIRMSATGEIKPCLCYGKTFDIKSVIREQTEEKLRETVRTAILSKPEAHCFEYIDEVTEEKRMVSIGG